MYLNMLGTDIVVLSSSETIADLLDKRSAIYSDKVTTIIALVQPGSDAIPVAASNTDNGPDGPEQMVVHDVQIRRKMEDIPSALSRILQCCNRGEV